MSDGPEKCTLLLPTEFVLRSYQNVRHVHHSADFLEVVEVQPRKVAIVEDHRARFEDGDLQGKQFEVLSILDEHIRYIGGVLLADQQKIVLVRFDTVSVAAGVEVMPDATSGITEGIVSNRFVVGEEK